MSELTITGKITAILKEEHGQSKAGKAWTRKSFVIDTGAKFNPLVCFGLFGVDKCAMIDKYQVGQTVDVSFNVSSSEHNGKWYANVDAWKIENGGGATVPETTDVGATDTLDDSDVPF